MDTTNDKWEYQTLSHDRHFTRCLLLGYAFRGCKYNSRKKNFFCHVSDPQKEYCFLSLSSMAHSHVVISSSKRCQRFIQLTVSTPPSPEHVYFFNEAGGPYQFTCVPNPSDGSLSISHRQQLPDPVDLPTTLEKYAHQLKMDLICHKMPAGSTSAAEFALPSRSLLGGRHGNGK